MVQEIARLRLAKAGSFRERVEAVESALRAGMPLWQIEQYLDMTDAAGACPGGRRAVGAGRKGRRPRERTVSGSREQARNPFAVG